MINLDRNLILVKEEDKTQQIDRWSYDKGKCNITYSSGKTYTYIQSDVVFYNNPIEIDIKNTMIFHKGIPFYKMVKALKFSHHTRIYFENNRTETYTNFEVVFIKSILSEEKSNNLFQYFKEIAYDVSLILEDGSNILGDRYKKLGFVREDSVLASYFSGKLSVKNGSAKSEIVYPFGFNESQRQAVENALSNQVSVIEGPPGTGKTQTILNIIANIVMQGKSVAVASSNNEATKNVYEKLDKNSVKFIAAYLGNSENKQMFVESQTGRLPDISSWAIEDYNYKEIHSKLKEQSKKLDDMLKYKNLLSLKQQEYDAILTEQKHFDEYYMDVNFEKDIFHLNKGLKSDKVLKLWVDLENTGYDKPVSLLKKISNVFKYGIYDKRFYKMQNAIRISIYQRLYYEIKLKELGKEIDYLRKELENYNFKESMKEYSDISMKLFKSKLYETYKGKAIRECYELDDLWKLPDKFIKDYPVILSTTYSLRSSLSNQYIYDYVIIDEASQVDLATGVLVLSAAKNVVVVGDLKQLPNVIKSDVREKTNKIFESYNIPNSYNYAEHSLLSSINNVYNDVARTMLKEHYRCHPKIIGFCNQKFYNNQLIILTEPKTEKDPLVVYKTVAGKHSRDHINERQIDVIEKEVIKQQKLDINKDSIGIVTPYRNQAERLQGLFINTTIKADTVDKFQGQERDVIILTTVDDEITEFADDSNRLNVAISRAIDQLIVVTDGNEIKHNTNMGELIGYIQYNNCEVISSKVYSVFDYLYKGYEKERIAYLKKSKRISEYDSENLMHTLISEVLEKDFIQCDVAMHIPLRMLIKDLTKLTDEEAFYMLNENTHVDFLIYSKLTHQPVLVIEVDGYSFHREGTKQADRDIKKNSILDKYKLPYIRFSTNGSGEKEKLIEKLKLCLYDENV